MHTLRNKQQLLSEILSRYSKDCCKPDNLSAPESFSPYANWLPRHDSHCTHQAGAGVIREPPLILLHIFRFSREMRGRGERLGAANTTTTSQSLSPSLKNFCFQIPLLIKFSTSSTFIYSGRFLGHNLLLYTRAYEGNKWHELKARMASFGTALRRQAGTNLHIVSLPILTGQVPGNNQKNLDGGVVEMSNIIALCAFFTPRSLHSVKIHLHQACKNRVICNSQC